MEQKNRVAQKRKNDWKYAHKRLAIVEREATARKPLHYYAKNMPPSYAYDDDDISERDRRQLEDFDSQMLDFE